MDQTQGGILQAVSNPKQFLFAPFEMAIVNIILSVAFMIILIAVLRITPFWAILPLVFGHIALIVMGTRNPHLTTTLQAMGKYSSSKKNIISVKTGVKYIP
jgi:hypothetical protein